MNTVVYYPHIYPTTEWLKIAALCWDKVYRLRPHGWRHDPQTIQNLNNALGGLLVDIDLEKAADLEVQRQFEQWIDARGEKLKTGALHSEARSLSQALREANPIIVSGELARSSEASVEHKAVDSMFTTIHGGKMGMQRGFLDLLRKHNLAWTETHAIKAQIPDWEEETYLHNKMPIEAPFEVSRPKPGSAHEAYAELREQAWKKKVAGDSRGAEMFEKKAEQIWQQHLITVEETQSIIHLPKDIALYYLSLCASKAALEAKRDLVADGEQFTDIVFHDFRTIQGEVAASVLQAYLPKNFLTMEQERLAEFRTEFATQRFKYEKEIQALVNEFADVASEGQLDVLKERVIDIAKERIEETKKVYTRAKVEMVISTFGLSLTPPALAASLASLLGMGIFAPVGIGAALSLFAAKSLLDWKKATSEKLKSPWSYVLDIAKMK
ncbi:hypothetical protein KSF_112910 [Reticulibacter mediterranei]|uniref:Uncharacterized protein n=1 Tax=Reticulibacter mediterranei TaxID=2778369 RepID=A0A8J3N6C5_9CHLR|nr:hypothetical protein [Reticulibacter mediterranei]GHO97418.1 hypothetical protein KSF_074660 [Reticulibacter mediterranei]GHP01244.1 hypothetical protein KSF_112910 [Reticulibacter mediterranei]